MNLRSALSILALGAGLLLGAAASAAEPAEQPVAPFDDGPYVFEQPSRRYRAWWICQGEVVRQEQRARRKGTIIESRCGYPHALRIPGAEADRPVAYSGGRIVALSDIHGQYQVMRRLLRAHGVIDGNDHWALGRDHLVVTGDVFDRGPQVTETFWLLFQLQHEAQAAGGAVHFLLGNHETMVLYGDLRYVNPKYLESARLLGRPYPALYGADSVIGAWLRTRPVMLRLGDTLFLHGGIAPENLDLVSAMDATNAAYRASLGRPKDAVRADPATARLYDGKRSPIWYRGYFNGDLSTADVQALLQRSGLARIVVGHTTMGEVASFHGGRIVAIDSGIKRGESGQLLFIEDGKLSRGLMDGRREALPELQSVPEDKD
ncbi:metallophosphoesterase [Lysobacter silvisoli]|uniref:Metallophosphoesterase n=1 Tax=Lysobacter silvisoli TaxID=2293254 RepID=A0A371K0U2_9GAMM|nr:metallophosphoesterase [Lysobacter silvisoli]RDZ27539.1 metallophosphoesterase [Lysobacter silvisoli]